MAWTQIYTVAIDRTKCGSGSLSNFPVLIAATHTSLKSTAHGGDVTDTTHGYDIVVYADDGTLSNYVPWEVEFWDAVNGVIWIWAGLPTVNGSSTGANTTFVVAWGNSAITTQQNTGSFAPANVWDSFFKMVLHFGSPAGTLSLNDSTSNGNNAHNPSPGSNFLGAQQIDGCLFANSSGGLQILSPSNFPSGADVFTMSCWFDCTNAGGTKYAFAIGAGTGTNHAMTINGTSGGVRGGLFGNELVTPGVEFVINHVVCSYDGTQQHVYRNGVEVSGSPNTQTSNIDQSFGSSIASSLDGNVDEARVSKGIARSADWILTEYNNQKSPGNIGSPDFLIWTGGASVSTNQPQMFVMT